MEYLIRLAQMHETFRRPELEALAVLHNVDLEILEYSDEVRREPFLMYDLFGVMVKEWIQRELIKLGITNCG
jgi:tRNA G10  N-methylase Trm11